MANHTHFIFIIQAFILISSCGRISSDKPTTDTGRQNEQRKKEISENIKRIDETLERIKKSRSEKESVTDFPVEHAQPFLLQIKLNSKMKPSNSQGLPDSIQIKQIPGLIAQNKRAPLLEKWTFTEVKYSSDRLQELLDADFINWDVELKILDQLGCSYPPNLQLTRDPHIDRPESIKLCGHNEIDGQHIALSSPILFLDHATVDILIDNPNQKLDSITTTRLYLVGQNRIRIKYKSLSHVLPQMSQNFRQVFTFKIVSIHGTGSLILEAYGSDYDFNKNF